MRSGTAQTAEARLSGPQFGPFGVCGPLYGADEPRNMGTMTYEELLKAAQAPSKLSDDDLMAALDVVADDTERFTAASKAIMAEARSRRDGGTPQPVAASGTAPTGRAAAMAHTVRGVS